MGRLLTAMAVLCIVLGLASGEAAAQPEPQPQSQSRSDDPFEGLSPEEAEQQLLRIQQAQDAERDGRWGDALDLYLLAYEDLPLEEYRFRAAICLEQLDRPEEALAIYRDLSTSERDEVAASARDRALDVERVLAARPARLRVVPSARDARVTVGDEAVVSAAPDGVVLELPAGEYEVLVERDGFVAATRLVTLAGGEERTLEVALEPDLVAASPPARDWTAPLVLGSLAVASGGVGVVLGLMAQDREAEERAYDRRADGHSRDGAEALGDGAERLALAANVTFGVAGALAIAAVVVFLLDDPEPDAGPAAEGGVSFRVTASGFSVAF